MAFNRDRNSRSGGGRGGFRPRFNDRGPARYASRSDAGGPVEMHSAVCDNCGKNCEVPFRPTSGKPVYCSDCFENQRGGTDSRSSGRYERRSPERPQNEQSSFDSSNKFTEINAKLDNILALLESQKQVVKEKKPAKIKEIEVIKEEEPTPIIVEEE